MISCNIYVDNQEIINYPIYEIIQKLDFIDYIFIYCGDQISYDIIQPLVMIHVLQLKLLILKLDSLMILQSLKICVLN